MPLMQAQSLIHLPGCFNTFKEELIRRIAIPQNHSPVPLEVRSNGGTRVPPPEQQTTNGPGSLRNLLISRLARPLL